LSLAVLSRLLGAQQGATGATGTLSRNGILHGRELSYNTRRNSTKAFVALIAAIEWAQPQARALMDAASRERELLYTGSDEVDEYGRRLDRRGFVEAKKSLDRVHSFQFGRRKRGRPYTDSLVELDPAGPLAGDTGIVLEVHSERDEYTAWVRTPSTWVLGVAGRDGEYLVWHYSARDAPSGGIDEDSSWRSAVEAPAHPDW